MANPNPEHSLCSETKKPLHCGNQLIDTLGQVAWHANSNQRPVCCANLKVGEATSSPLDTPEMITRSPWVNGKPTDSSGC